MHWLNADEITDPGVYLWKRGPIIVAKADELWPITITAFAESDPGTLVILVMGGVPMGPVKGSPGRFFGPVPIDDPDDRLGECSSCGYAPCMCDQQ